MSGDADFALARLGLTGVPHQCWHQKNVSHFPNVNGLNILEALKVPLASDSLLTQAREDADNFRKAELQQKLSGVFIDGSHVFRPAKLA